MAIQARTEFASALNQVCSERGLEPEVVVDSIKQAIIAAYRKDYGEIEGIDVDLNVQTGEVSLSKDKKNITPPGFGRIAAQTAKQVILQRIREAEKNAILEEYSSKINTIVSGLVQRISGPVVTVNLGKAEGIMPPAEQSHNEKYFVNQRLKFFVMGIKEGARGEEIIVSRSANGLLENLFRQEVPEIAQGSVEIKAIAREAGSRSKVAVASGQLGVDPVGSCVGQKGVRVQAVINELGDEKIDVIAYQEDIVEFIKAALSPAKDLLVKVSENDKTAEVITPDDQLSLAIGKEGQNVRLAAKLTGYKIDIKGKSGTPKEVEAKEKALQEEAKRALGITKDSQDLETVQQDKKEKGTSESATHVQADQATQPKPSKPQNSQSGQDQPQAVQSQPSQDRNITPSDEDQEPLIADQEERREEKEAGGVADQIAATDVSENESVKEQTKNQSGNQEQTSSEDSAK